MNKESNCFFEYLNSGFDSTYQKILIWLPHISDFFNSNFMVAATGSFFGAVGGYVMVMITDKRKEALSKIGTLKAAISISHVLFNASLGLYKQHIKTIFETYDTDRKRFIVSKDKASTTQEEIHLTFDHRFIVFPHLDFNLINSKLLEKTDLSGRAFILATTLISSFSTLKSVIHARHEALELIKNMSHKYQLTVHDTFCLYFGIKFSHPVLGDIMEQRYFDTMMAIKDSNEDCTWFSKELTQALIDEAKKISKSLTFRRPKIGGVDYSDVDPNLLPPDAHYKDWRDKFKPQNAK